MAKNIYKYLYVYHYLRYKRYGYSNSEIYSSVFMSALFSINILTILSVLFYCKVITPSFTEYKIIPILLLAFIGLFNDLYLRKNMYFINEIQELTPIVRRNKYYIILYELFSVGLLLFLVWLNHK